MAKELILRKGTAAQHSTFIGKLAELTVITDTKDLALHDNSTAGGIVLAKKINLDNHTSRVNNPHNVTKSQVGLGNVKNIDSTIASNISQDSTHRFVTDAEKINWNGKINDTEKAVANGVATLDVNGKVVLTQIPDSILGQLQYMGIHNFSSSFPTATEKGQYWIASSDGNGYTTGDWAVWNGTSFNKIDNTDAVATVAGRTGNVVLTKSDVGLSNVDNTSDANKPVSTATQNALNTKVGTTGNQTIAGIKTFSSNIVGSISGNSETATKLATERTITMSGDLTGSVNFDGSSNVTLSAQVNDNSHNHTSLSGTVRLNGSTGNDYTNSNITLDGNGTANTIKPGIGFNQPSLYAGMLFMLDKNTFQFQTQNGSPANLDNSITGNAAYAWSAGIATTLSTNRNNYKGTTDSAVVGELIWKNGGNGHTIFDASNSTSPTEVDINNTNPDSPWAPTYPTLMGYNGANTFGVRVDSSRYADQLKTARTINGVAFDGTANITVADSTKLPTTGGTVTGALAVNGLLAANGGFKGHYVVTDNRALVPSATPKSAIGAYFTSQGGLTGAANTVYGDLLTLNSYNDTTGGLANALFFAKGSKSIFHYQAAQGATTWGDTSRLAYVTDNVASATKLATARTINGVAFDGTANITVPAQTSITTTEFITEMVRNTKQVYGIEVDIGLMPNATVKNVAFAFNALYTYWIDNQNSYCANSSASYPINYAGNIGESISCYLDRTNKLIKVLTSDDKSTFTGKVILLYTK